MGKRVFKTVQNKKAWFSLGLLSLCLLGIMTGIAGDAFAQSTRDLMNRLNRLENELETLNRAVYKDERADGPAYTADNSIQAAMEVRLQQVETELRDLRGTLEEQNFKLDQMQTQLDKSLQDMAIRLNDLEKNGRAPVVVSGDNNVASPNLPVANPRQAGTSQQFRWSSNADDSAAPVADSTVMQKRVEADTGRASFDSDAATKYENAFAKLKNSQYEVAAREFEAFIAAYPDHALVGNARYWLGETHYVRGNYDRAARIFAEGFQKDPKGTKATDNLLKLGMSLGGAGNTGDACVALDQLEKEFPNATDQVLRRAEQEMKRLGC